MRTNIFTHFRKTLILILLAALLVLAVQPATPALAHRQDPRTSGARTATQKAAKPPTATFSLTPTLTDTPTITFTLTPTLTNTSTGTSTPTQTATNTPTQAASMTHTPSLTNTPVRTATLTNTPTVTNTPTALATSDWSAMGTGTNGNVYAIAVTTTAVYAGGDFTSVGTCTSNCNRIAKWDGSTWSSLGTGLNGSVYAIAVIGSSVYAGGSFTSAGTCASNCTSIARWNGSSWSAMSLGMGGVNPIVRAFDVSGSDLYVGGYFASAGTCTSVNGCNNIAKWNGTTWSALGAGMGGDYPYVYGLALSGSYLYAAGDFTSAGACTTGDGCNKIALWNGSTWSALGTGTNDTVWAVAVSGTSVYAGGDFLSAGTCTIGCRNIAKWDGSTWSALDSGINGITVRTLVTNGSNLHAGGDFLNAGTCTTGCTDIARWDGSTWSTLGMGTNGTVVFAIDVSGSALYAGGSFSSAGTCTSGCNNIARYDLATNASLSSLVLSRGTLVPAFDPGTTTYMVDVINGVASLVVTPTAADTGASIQVRINAGDWSAVPSGSPSRALPLDRGENTIDVQVTAEDGTMSINYTVLVKRAQFTWIYLPMVIQE
jgi:hypothetical protein